MQTSKAFITSHLTQVLQSNIKHTNIYISRTAITKYKHKLSATQMNAWEMQKKFF